MSFVRFPLFDRISLLYQSIYLHSRAKTKCHFGAILRRSQIWNKYNNLMQPSRAKAREKSPTLLYLIFTSLLGVALAPRRNQFGKYDFIVEGVRSLSYINYANTKRVAIIGSWPERHVAKSLGYDFIFSFPIRSAFDLYSRYKTVFFLFFQDLAWRSAFSNKLTLILTYEDTQPLGLFLGSLARSLGKDDICKTVCIQHGHFPNNLFDIPMDGSFTDYNFLWDISQVNVIKCCPTKCYEIGPPVDSKVDSTQILRLVLVGSGTNGSGTGDYDRLLDFYRHLYNLLPMDILTYTTYRPHPNELCDLRLKLRLTSLFCNVDTNSKEDLLGNPPAIFLGTVSSLLYEAHFCGHTIIGIEGISAYERLSFTPDFLFSHDDLTSIATMISRLFLSDSGKRRRCIPPKHSFQSAITELGLLTL